MRRQRNRKGFTIIELLIVVIVIGVLAAAGLAKYQNFAEMSRRKTCIGQLHTLETGMAVWETNNIAFAENAKCAFGFSTRTGRLDNGAIQPTMLNVNTGVALITDAVAGSTVGGPTAFANTGPGAQGNIGPLNTVIRDDGVWDCPAATARYYNSEIQNVGDDYMDTSGGGVGANPRGAPIGLGGRYIGVVCGKGNGPTALVNGGFPAGLINSGALAAGTNLVAPCPQTPFKIVICACYGTFGVTTGGGSNTPGSTATNQGGPVGPDGSSLSRHSSRW